jgi:hypothetical protein
MRPGHVQDGVGPHLAEGAGEPALRWQDGGQGLEPVLVRGEAVRGFREGEGQEVGAPDQRVQVDADVARLPTQGSLGALGADGRRATDAGLHHLGIGRLQVGQQPDSRIALRDASERIRECGDARVQLPQGLGQLRVLPLELRGRDKSTDREIVA